MRYASSALIMGSLALYLAVSAAWEGIELWRLRRGLRRFDDQLRTDEEGRA